MAGFHSFDGSKYNPIEESSLILNTPIDDLFITTPEKFESDNAKGFHSFDGSNLNPIDEAFLILNSPIEDEFITPVSESKTEFHSFDGSRFNPIEEAFLLLNSPMEDLFVSPPAACIAGKGGEITKHIELKENADCSSLPEVEYLDEKTQTKGQDTTLKIQRELLEIKAHIKVLGWVLESSLRRTDMLLPKLARQNVLVAC
ncbi:hypothetical protein SUGI_0580120 [Cryptomeria japonica]|nr:hypothetical protein SUGI_0580120 [Cryptomeria japonica]